MAKIFFLTTIICGTGWGVTHFLLMTMICYVKRKSTIPTKKDLKDCAEFILRRYFKVEK